MDLTVSEILGSLLVFGVLVSASFLPYFFVRFHARRSRGAFKRNSCHQVDEGASLLVGKFAYLPWFSLCNCFAAGVFLATCFIGLVPHVREHVQLYEKLSKSATLSSATSAESSTLYPSLSKDEFSTSAAAVAAHLHKKRETPWTELLLIVGFLSVLLLDEIVQICRRKSEHDKHSSTTLPHVAMATKAGTAGNKNRLDDHHNHHVTSQQDLLDGLPLLPSAPANHDSSSKSNGAAATGSYDIPSQDIPSHDIPLIDGIPPPPGGASVGANGKDEFADEFNHFRSSSSTTDSQGSVSHAHHDPSAMLMNGESLTWRSAALLLSLSIHGLFEGVALGLQETSESFFRLLVGVMTHETLCAVAFGINLAGHGVKTRTALTTMLLLAATVPSGMLVGLVVRFNQSAASSPGGLMARIVLEGFAAGTFVYVAFFDMLNHELSDNGGHGHGRGHGRGQNYRLLKIICVCFGFFLFFFITSLL